MVLPNIKNMRTYLLGGAGAALFLLGTVLVFKWPSIFSTILYNQMQVIKGSRTFDLWRDTPVPMHMNFYFYNWTNPEDVETNKPILVQMGPYRFNVVEKKTNITEHSNGTVTFLIRRQWYFDKENSNGSLDDVVTTLNAVAMSAAFTARDWSTFLQTSISFSMATHNIKVFIRQTVGDLLFEGYSDPLIDMARSLPSFAGIDIPYDKFAWFYKRNGSNLHEGIFNMDTGENDIFNIGKLHNWNYQTTTGFYDDHCGMINGSAGELYPPKQTKKTKLELFSADLCRSISLSFKEEVDLYGIKGYKYVGDEYTFDNGTLDENNKCFCNGECSPSGVLNVTSCRYGAPGFISFPNFYLADDFYKNQVEGIHADPDKHTLYITLEPETGIPLDVAARFQVNILLAPYKFVSKFKNVPRIVFPMLWLEQRGSITESLALQVKLALLAPSIGQMVFFLLLMCGLMIVAYASFVIYKLYTATNLDISEMKRISLIQNGNSIPLLENDKDQMEPNLKRSTFIN